MTSAIDTPAAARIATPERLTMRTILGFLVSRRDAILAAASARSSLWIGLLFVLAAALAREYDAEDLLREPWHLLISPIASILISLPLYAVIRRYDDPDALPFGIGYRQFLALFWLTAPLALLYGIPYERFLTPLDAVRANLWTLALVATWRIVLMTRVVSVLTGRHVASAFFLVMAVADVFAVIALMIVPVPVLQIMGGIELTQAESLLQSASLTIRFFGIIALPVLLIGLALFRPAKREPARLQITPSRPSRVLLLCTAAMIAIWLVILPFTQREQQLRSHAESLLKSGDIKTALDAMSLHERSDYPPHWDPPPRIGWPGPESPPLMQVLDVIIDHPPAQWVREVYLDKFERRYLSWGARFDPSHWPETERVLRGLPEGPEIMTKRKDFIDRIRQSYEPVEPPATQPTTRGAP